LQTPEKALSAFSQKHSQCSASVDESSAIKRQSCEDLPQCSTKAPGKTSYDTMYSNI